MYKATIKLFYEHTLRIIKQAVAVSHNTSCVDSAEGGRACLLIAWILFHT